MCVACIEFIKKTLTAKEYKSALLEMTRDELTREQEQHFIEVRNLLDSTADDDELRKKLQATAKSVQKS
jgi:hypothetical protein